MRHRLIHRTVAAALVASTVLLYANLPLSAGSLGSVEGRVTTEADRSPRGGVVVMLVDASSQAPIRSATTDARGAFRIEDAVPGSYRLAVDTPEGTFLASSELTVSEGKNRPIALALNRQTGETPPPPPPPQARSGLAPWQKWVIVGGIAVGALLVVDAVTEEESDSSPF